jgi:LPXTG-motif cell wall-anchored protein
MKCLDRGSRASHRPIRWCLLLIAVVLAAWIASVQAAPIQITGTFRGQDVGRPVTYTYAGTTTTNWAGSLLLDIDNGPTVPVFCIQILVPVRAGDRYRNDGPVKALQGGCQIQYLLEHYPASTANTPDEAAARQMAIWVFSDNLDPTTITDAVVRDRTIALASEAQLGQCPSQRTDPPDLTLAPPTASATVGQSVTYTVQAGAQDAGASVSLTVTGPATFADGQQQGGVTLDAQGAATFQVQIAGPGDVTVNASLPYQLKGGVVFSQLDPNVQTQRLVIAGTLDRIATAAAQLSAVAPTATPTTMATPTAVPAPQPTEKPAPTPTRRPSRPRSTAQPITVTPTAEQPTESLPAVIEATAMPAPTEQPTQIAPEQAAGAAAGRPESLPNTGGSTGIGPGIIGGLVAVLLIGGWLLRKRGARF